MKLLLISLSVGLHIKDINNTNKKIINNFISKKFIILKDNIYKFNSKYRAGTLSVIQNNSAYLNIIGKNSRDLYIPEGGLLNAKEGDFIIAQRLLGVRGAPKAKVIEVVGRAPSYSVGIITYSSRCKSIVDIKTDFPIDTKIDLDELNRYEIGDVFKINNQDGEIMQHLGNIKNPKVDESIVLAQFNKHDKFEEDVLKTAKSFQAVNADIYPKRKDLRTLPFCTIDPVTAKDYDDAIYWDEHKSTLYVAIADVSEYVDSFGNIDNEAIYRSFSIYLPHLSIPMLPRQLSENLCSLGPNVDRLAYVFEIKLSVDSKIGVSSSKVYEAIIHSKRRFNYKEIDDYFDKKIKAQNKEEEIIFKSLTSLKIITDRLKKERLILGYDFKSSEIEMKLDDNSNLIETTLAEETPSHSLIEDCMLLANKEAAKQFEKGIFRIHEEPSQAKIQKLYQELSEIGINIDIKNSTKETIADIQEQAKEMNLKTEVDLLIIRSQMQAKYAPLNSGHFGLGFEAYTHFTSPIRRYSDLIVHRLLKAINNKDTKESSYVLRNIEALSIAISEKEREASTIEKEYMARKFARWADKNIDKEFKAKISSTDPELKAELNDEIIGARLNITAILTDTTPMLFEDVKIKIQSVDIVKAKISAYLVSRASEDV